MKYKVGDKVVYLRTDGAPTDFHGTILSFHGELYVVSYEGLPDKHKTFIDYDRECNIRKLTKLDLALK